MSQYGDMRPLFSGAHIVAPNNVDYKDQRADFLAMTLVEKRLGMLKKFNFIGYNSENPDEIDESVLDFAELLGKYHRALSEEDNLTNKHSAALLAEYKKSDAKAKEFYDRTLAIAPAPAASSTSGAGAAMAGGAMASEFLPTESLADFTAATSGSAARPLTGFFSGRAEGEDSDAEDEDAGAAASFITIANYVAANPALVDAKHKFVLRGNGFAGLVREASTDDISTAIGQAFINEYNSAVRNRAPYKAPQEIKVFPINLAKLFLKSETGYVTDPALSLIFAESADPEVWIRNSAGKLVAAENGAEAGAANVGNDACAGTKVNPNVSGLNCTDYVSKCLIGQNIDACRAYFANKNFYTNTIAEVQSMDPMVAVKMLRKFGFKEVSEYDSDQRMNIVTIEPVAKWIEGLTGKAEQETINAISANDQLKNYLGWIIQLVNRNPSILNPGYRGDLDANSHDPNRFAYTGFAKMGIKARRPVRNSCYKDIDAIANAIDQNNITLGIRVNSPIVGGIVPIVVRNGFMNGGGSYATISQSETSVAALKSNRRNTSEILSKTFEYLTKKLEAFNKGISTKDSSKINELINDLAKKENKLYEVIDFVEKYAMLVDVFGEKRVAEVVTVDQMKKAVQARSKLFSKKVKRETDIVSVLKSLTGAVEQETPSGQGNLAGTASGF